VPVGKFAPISTNSAKQQSEVDERERERDSTGELRRRRVGIG